MKHGWIAALAAASFSASAHANLVVNGGFETGDFSNWARSGNSGYTGVDSSSAYGGAYGAYFGPVGSEGTISQDLATTPGQTYELSFWLSNGGSYSNAFLVDWDGTQAMSISSSPVFAYEERTLQLTATDSTTTLTFAFRNDPSYWDFDDVSVTPAGPTQPDPSVPAPSVLALLGIGVFGLAGTRRRKA